MQRFSYEASSLASDWKAISTLRSYRETAKIVCRRLNIWVIEAVGEGEKMVVYHRNTAFEPRAKREGGAFVATASILEEDGELTSLGRLGLFASEDSALAFAIRCATSFIDGLELPRAPVAFL